MAPSLSERPLSLQARSSFSMAADSSGFQPDNPNWWMPTTSAPRGSFQEFIFLASTLFASQWAPPHSFKHIDESIQINECQQGF